MTVQRAESGTIQGVHVLWGMIAFFAAILAINIGFTIVAVRTFPGEYVRKSYLQGLHYNAILAERARARALRWTATADLRTASEGAVLHVELSQPSGAPIIDAEVRAMLRRPATDRDDRTLALQHVGAGAYEAPVGALGPGVWTLRGAVTRNGQKLDFERRLIWRSTT